MTLFLLFLLNSCVEIPEFDNTPRGNFEALWRIMDEHYCFFDEKNVDWNQVHTEYSARIHNVMQQDSLFYILNEMLQKVKDGHVNLVSPFDLGRYWKWFEDYPVNYKQELIDRYMGTDYKIAGGLRYKLLLPDSIGYIRYADFSSSISNLSLDYILLQFRDCRGIILDVRNNGGGTLTNSELLASRFFTTKDTVSYIQHKTGKGHNDFSKPIAQTLTPSERLRFEKPVVALTNRKCYSATNDFINTMRYAPNATILGDWTGGGGGLPFSSELPNGWSVRFSACPTFDRDMQPIEAGIAPDIHVELSEEDALKGKDSLIEAAIALIFPYKNVTNP
ncbi:peptidase S41 [Bacteroidia bacterium]|nr:peptidase S41 [Bacteroidia bacterium]